MFVVEALLGRLGEVALHAHHKDLCVLGSGRARSRGGAGLTSGIPDEARDSASYKKEAYEYAFAGRMMPPSSPMLPASASFHAGDLLSVRARSQCLPSTTQRAVRVPAPIIFLLSSYAQKRQIEYVICRSHVPEMPSKRPRTPAVRTVFFNELTIPLSPVACMRTFVRSSGL